MKPKISIVLPTYNRGNIFLVKAINSVLNQSFKDFELIIIDDASTDETEKIISKFNDKRIQYIKTEKNHGEYWSTNYGISLAQGDYLTWIHSDDIMPPDSLFLRVKELETNSKLDFVHGDIIKIDENDKLIEKIGAVDWSKKKILSQYLLLPEKRIKKYLIHHLTIMMRWNFFYKAGPFDCSLPFAGDIDWLIRAIRIGNFKKINSILYHYRTHLNSRRIQDILHGVNKQKVLLTINKRYE